MPVFIKKQPFRVAEYRLLIAEKYGDEWTLAPMLGEEDTLGNRRQYGFEVLSWERKSFPDIGQARIRYHYGFLTWKLYQIDSAAGDDTRLQPTFDGDDFVSSRLRYLISGRYQNSRRYKSDFADATGGDQTFIVQDLANYEVRIQEKVVIPGDAGDPDEEEWRDVFWGKAGTPTDVCMPGSEIPQGVMEWTINDGTARLGEWPLNKHRFVVLNEDGDTLKKYPETFTGIAGVVGNPGYNIPGDAFGQVLGNQAYGTEYGDTDPDNKGYYAHTWPGSRYSTTFSDADVVTTSILSSKPRANEPDFTLKGFTSNTLGTNTLDILRQRSRVWETSEGMSVRQLLIDVLDRRRGINAFLWFDMETPCTDLSASAFTPYIAIAPTFYDDITKTLPDNSVFTLGGARNLSGTEVKALDLDIVADQRIGSQGDDGQSSFKWAEAALVYYDQLVTRGETIVVGISVDVGTEGPNNGHEALVLRSTEAERTAYDESVDAYDGVMGDWVYTVWGFPFNWEVAAYNPNNDTVSYLDYSIVYVDHENRFAQSVNFPTVTVSPNMVRVLDGLPIYTGVNYATNPPTASFNFSGTRTPVDILVYDNEGFNAVETLGVQVQRAGNMGNDLIIRTSGPVEEIGTLGLTLSLAITTGERLQWTETRRDKDGNYVSDISKIKYIDVPGMALHVLDPSFKFRSGETLQIPDQHRIAFVTNNQPMIIRDDRAELAKFATFAAEFYLKPRRPFTLSLKTVGGHHQAVEKEVEGLETGNGGYVNSRDQVELLYRWPRIGDFIHNLTYSGRSVVCNGTVTSYAYNHETGVVTIETDWMTREFL